MAASSKPTGVHYALVVFVLISIVCGLGWLLAYKGANSISELEAKAKEEKRKADEQNKVAGELVDDLNRIKDLLNSKFESVGDGSNPNTVAGDIKQHIRQYGEGGVDETYNGIIVKLAELKRNMSVARDKLNEELIQEQARFKQQIDELNARLMAEKTARDSADKAKNDADNDHQEKIKKRDEDIAEQKKSIIAMQQQFDEDIAAAQKRIKDLDQRVTSLQVINKKLSAELDEKTRVSFEVPDGEVRWVDHVGKRVWVNLGDADGLKPRTTFSVYKKTHSGVGRGTEKGQIGGEDIKGAIEITRILEPNLSEARIVDEDIYAPISKGDPIYSPLWSSGRGEAFSIIGIMDLNGDGRDDRDLLKEAVATAGAVIDNDVDEKGILKVNNQVPDDGKPRITERTKFVVIGKIPEIAETADPDEIATIQKILGLRKELEDAARERGVRVLSLGDFISYIGYVSQRRLFVPGEDAPYKLKSGSASAAVGEALGANRKSAGTTSSQYSGDKNLKAKTFSGGANAKVFRK
jgi:hypothetical protein